MKPPTNKELADAIRVISARIDALEKGLTVTKPTADPVKGLKWDSTAYDPSFPKMLADREPVTRQSIIDALNKVYDEFGPELTRPSYIKLYEDVVISAEEEEDGEFELFDIINTYFGPSMSTAYDDNRDINLVYLLKK